MTLVGPSDHRSNSPVQQMAAADIARAWQNWERSRSRLASHLLEDNRARPWLLLLIFNYLRSLTSSNGANLGSGTQIQEEINDSTNEVASRKTELQSLSAPDAIDWYLDHKRNDVTEGTIDSYRTSLQYFVSFCERNDIEDLNHLTGRDIEAFRKWRREESVAEPLQPKSMRDQMYLLRDFLRYLGAIEAVPTDLHEKVVIPTLGPGDGVSEVRLEQNRAKQILTYLQKYEYASTEHVFWQLLGVTGRRIGGIHTLDVDDYHPDVENPYLAFRHRPEQGTRLKNGPNGETNVNIDLQTRQLLDDYLEDVRPDVSDDHGRQPLLSTEHGRLTTSTMRKYVYKWSRPCMVGADCPHDRVVDSCEAIQSTHQASKCPSSVSPHAVRHGYISSMLGEEVPKPVLSERCDVSESVIDQHYDNRTEAERQDLRKRIFEQVFDHGRSGYID